MSKFRKKTTIKKENQEKKWKSEGQLYTLPPQSVVENMGQFFQMELLCPSNKEGKTVVVLFLFLLIGFFSNDP